MTKQSDSRTVYHYFGALLVATVPFWILGTLTHVEGLPFGMQLNVLLVLAVPVVALLAGLITSTYAPFDGWALPFYWLPVYFAVYYLAAALEEIGWTWFATPLLVKKLGVLDTGLSIGLVWVAIHTLPWWQQSGWRFMVGMSLFSLLSRLFMTWLYLKRGGWLWLVIAYHAMINTTFTLFHAGSAYANPLVYAALLFLIMIAILLVGSTKKPSHATVVITKRNSNRSL